MKVKPIKIVNTTLSTGGKQLQIVPVKSISEPVRHSETEKPKEEKIEIGTTSQPDSFDKTEDQKKELFAHLQLQSKSQAEKDKKSTTDVPEKAQSKDCIFEYEEPEEEFAEKRDREWALQKKLDESRRKEEEYSSHHFSKKRKKNKHSKNEFNLHKKRKLHAEIASNEAELKLKVKITNNGHKHKHHKSSGQANEKMQIADSSSKEKLLQMRQVRHKNVTSEDKNIQTLPNTNVTALEPTDFHIVKTEKLKDHHEEKKKHSSKSSEDIKKLKIKVAESPSKVSELAVLPKHENELIQTSPKVGTFPDVTSSKERLTVNLVTEAERSKTVPNVHVEHTEQTDKVAQKTFLKPSPVNPEKPQKIEKTQQPKVEDAKMKNLTIINKSNFKADQRNDNKIKTNNKILDRQIANLQQQCTIEPKQPESLEKKPVSAESRKFLTSRYHLGFTVSKVEQGIKRKAEDGNNIHAKRPSLEITLISPPTSISSLPTQKTLEKTQVKRPPPATIPLEKIKKSVNLKTAGISIIPKMPSEKCDNIGALDLSKPNNKPAEIIPKNSHTPNGFSVPTNRQLNALSKPTTTSTSEKNNMGLSNLHMLSKVATEHSTLNKSPSPNKSTNNKPKPQMPSLQTIKIPAPQVQNKPSNANLQRMPKLNEIPKFRPNMPIRSVRPNQNQNIRNIPNPSLLIRQQNQNRLNSQMNSPQLHSADTLTPKVTSATTAASPTIQKESSTTITALKVLESKVQEKKEISV